MNRAQLRRKILLGNNQCQKHMRNSSNCKDVQLTMESREDKNWNSLKVSITDSLMKRNELIWLCICIFNCFIKESFIKFSNYWNMKLDKFWSWVKIFINQKFLFCLDQKLAFFFWNLFWLVPIIAVNAFLYTSFSGYFFYLLKCHFLLDFLCS